MADGEIVDAAEGGDVGHVAAGDVALELGAESVCGDEAAGIGGREHGGGEDGGGVVDEAGVGVSEEQREAVGETALDLDLAGVVVGFAAVVAVDGDIEEARIGLEELGGADGFAADGAGDGQLTVVGIGDGGEERGALRELRGGELVEVGIGNADVDDVRAGVGEFDGEVGGDFALDGEVPLLGVAGAGGADGGVDALAEAGIGGEGDGGDGGSAGEGEGGVDAVLCFLLDVLDEGELRRGEGRGDSGLVDEDDAEAGADDGFGREQVGEADARGDVGVVEFAGAAGVAVDAEVVELLGA